VSASTHRLPEWTGRMLLSHFTEDFLCILRDLGEEARYRGAAWQRQFYDPFPKRRCHEQTGKGEQGVMTAFPRLLSRCHWIPLSTRFW
jgi:hypothetical protein